MAAGCDDPLVSVSRTVLTAAAAWLAVVAVGSVLVWSVISRAGDVETDSQAAVPAATGTTGGASAQPPTSEPSTPSDSTGSPDSESERRTWQGPGGYVSVECRSQAVSLVAAQADAGFVVEVDNRGPEEVTVAFEGQGEEGRETDVSAVCRAAVPEFEVNAEG